MRTFVRLLRYCNSHGGLPISRPGWTGNCGRRGGSTLNPILATSPVGGATIPEGSTTDCIRLSDLRLRGSCWVNSHGTGSFLVCSIHLG